MDSFFKVTSINCDTKNSICCLCLSTGRKLQSANIIQTLQIWPGVDINLRHDFVCWECEAMTNKLLKFKNQVFKAQEILKCNISQGNIKSLSSLNVKSTNEYDAEMCHTDIEKTEPPDYFEFNNCDEQPSESNDYGYKENCHNFSVNEENIDKKQENIDEKEGNFNEKEVNINEKEEKTDEKVEKSDLVEIVKSEFVEPKKILLKGEKSVERKRKVKRKSLEKTGRSDGKFRIAMMSEEELSKAREMDKAVGWYKGSIYKCETCILGYRHKEKYDKHMYTKHAESCGKYVCNVCEVRFVTKREMASHCEWHYRRYECTLCPTSHHQLKAMMRHYIKEHENRKYICRICANEFVTWRALRYHRDMMHKEKPKCEQCGRQFPNETNLKRHLVVHTDIPLSECPICHKRYRGAWGLKSHMRFHDANAATEDAYCAECNIQFKNAFLYKSHLKKNSRHITPDLKKHECPVCGKRFLEKIFLKRHHDGVHLKKKEHVCDMCSKMYVKAYSLRQHIRLVHEGATRPRDKVCDICQKRFTCKAFLKQHLNSHTGDRPYQCGRCSATFGYASALYMHTKLIHLKLKRGGKSADDMEPAF